MNDLKLLPPTLPRHPQVRVVRLSDLHGRWTHPELWPLDRAEVQRRRAGRSRVHSAALLGAIRGALEAAGSGAGERLARRLGLHPSALPELLERVGRSQVTLAELSDLLGELGLELKVSAGASR